MQALYLSTGYSGGKVGAWRSYKIVWRKNRRRKTMTCFVANIHEEPRLIGWKII